MKKEPLVCEECGLNSRLLNIKDFVLYCDECLTYHKRREDLLKQEKEFNDFSIEIE